MAATPSTVAPAAEVKQCLTCWRWVSTERHAVMPVGADPMCGLCLAMSELQAAIAGSNLTIEREGAVHQALWRAHVLVVNTGRGTVSRPYIHLGRQEEQSASE